MRVGADGWVDAARRVPSPNFDARPAATAIRLVVVHAISLPPGEFGGTFIEDFFCNRLDSARHPYFESIRELRVAAHFLIRRDGELLQFVSCDSRAWHAGVSTWKGVQRCNDFSIGIELEGCDDSPFEALQYKGLNDLLAVLATAYPIADVCAHSDIAPGRKTDPGPCFDWSRVDTCVSKIRALAKKRLHDV